MALIDTGSQVTTVSRSFYEEYMADCTLRKMEELLIIEGAGGQSVPFLGYIETEVSFPKGTSGLNQSLGAVVLVVPDTNFNKDVPLVIGTNVIKQCKDDCVDKYGVNFFRVAQPDLAWRLAYRHLTGLNRKVKKAFSNCKVRVNSNDALVIPAMQTTVVWTTIKTQRLNKSFWSLVEGEESALPEPLHVLPALVRVQMDGGTKRIAVRVDNPSTSDVKIPPRIVCSSLQQVEVVGDCLEQDMKPEPEIEDSKPGTEGEFPLDRSLLTNSQLQEAESFLSNWESRVFSGSKSGCAAVKHKIDLSDNKPFKQRHRRIPPAQYEEVRQHLKDLLAEGVIRESHSPWSSPVVLVRKRDGSLRLCIDYRKLNERTIKDAYALPRIEESLEAMGGCAWFSTLDLKSGYYQVEIQEADKEKTAFTAGPLGFYEYNRMPFGLTNAPATFQRLMEHCLADLNFSKCIVYIDDVIVYSKTFEDHLERLEAVFSRLEEYGLKLKRSKCSFLRNKVKYLGHVISEFGIETDPDKTSAVREWPVPTCAKELQTFLGFTGYYRRFIPKYAKLAKPLTDLVRCTSKGNKCVTSEDWNWSADCQKAFEELVHILSCTLVLKYPDFTKPFVLNTDASMEGLGATLSQVVDGKERVVAYASRALRKSERNYPVHKLEFLSLKWAIVEKFHDYLYGNTFTVRTDNNPLTYVTTTAKLDATGHRWLASLSNYNFNVEYRSGKKNVDADALSRQPHDAHMIDNDAVKALCQPLTQEDSDLICEEHLMVSINEAHVSDFIDSGRPEPLPSLDRNTLRRLQEEDRVIGKAKAYLRNGRKPTIKEIKGEDKDVRRVLRLWDQLVVLNDILYRQGRTGPQGDKVLQLLIPETLKQTALRGIHNDVGHFGVSRSVDLARSRFYWPGMIAEVEEWVRTCKECTLNKAPQPLRAAPLVNITTSEPLELVCMDYLKLDRCKGGYENVLVITDHFTKYAQAVPTMNQTAKTTAKALFDKFIVHYGFPKRIHSDQGRNFESNIISELCKLASVAKTRTTPYHPMGNGMCERFNRTLIHMLGTLTTEKKSNWKEFISPVIHAYNSTKHDSTGVSPFYLMFGRHPRLAVDVYLGHDPNGLQKDSTKSAYIKGLKERLDYAYKLAQENSKHAAKHQKQGYDKRTRGIGPIEPGDRVMIKNLVPTGKLDNYWEDGVYIVLSKPNEDIPVYCVKPENGGKKRLLHRNLMTPFPPQGFHPMEITQPSEAIANDRPKRIRRRPKRLNSSEWVV